MNSRHNRGSMRNSSRISKEQALSFLLTHLVVDQQQVFELGPKALFSLMHLAAQAEERINNEEGVIPHEIIEELAREFLDSL